MDQKIVHCRIDRDFVVRHDDVTTVLTSWIRAHPDEFTFEGLIEKP